MGEAAGSPDLDELRLVAAVASARGLPAAAARLGIDHSTAFRRLRQLEARLGRTLFERHRAGYAPTPAGEALAALAERVEGEIAAVARQLAGEEPAPSGEVRLATSDSLLADLLMPMLAGFLRAQPAIRLDLVTGNAALNLSRRDADVAVRATDRPPDTLVGRRAARIAWALYGPPGASAEASPWVCLGDNLAGLRVVRHAQDRVPPGRLAARFDTVGGLSLAVRAGLGVGHLPCFVGDAAPELVRLAPPEPAFGTELWLLTHPDLRRAPRVRALLDALAAAIAARRPLIEGETPRAGPD